jgi:hypothetical protein
MTTMSEFNSTSKIISKYMNPLNTQCSNCNELFNQRWVKDTHCFFCNKFLPFRDTHASIVKEIDWYFMLSGYTTRKKYYNEFLDYLNKWFDKFNVTRSDDDMKKEAELRKVQDWTRDYWH